MDYLQKEISLQAKGRGFHLITSEILKHIPELTEFEYGLCHIFIKHTSASLSINENADPTVRQDFESSFNHLVKENQGYYRHTMEGPDDMPAHIKASLLGSSLTIPVTSSRLNLGTWQGIYLCEHRNQGGQRHLVISIQGKKY